MQARTDPPALVGNERAASQHGNYAASCTTPCSLIQPPARPSTCAPSLVARSRCPDCSGSVRASLPLECAPATAPTECRPPSPRSPAPLWHVQEGRDGGREGGRRQASRHLLCALRARSDDPAPTWWCGDEILVDMAKLIFISLRLIQMISMIDGSRIRKMWKNE